MIRTWLRAIARSVQAARERKGLNQEQLGELAQVTRKTISQIENGRNYQIENLFHVLVALELDPWTFFGGAEQKNSHPQHADIVEQLVSVLERGGPEAEWLKGNIITFYRSMIRARAPRR